MNNAKSPLKARLVGYLPFAAFFLLVVILLLSSTLSRHPPEVKSISPEIGSSGDELVITGKSFGESRNGGYVTVGGISPPASSYQWSDGEIRFIVPDEMSGGIVSVATRRGESGEVICFTNNRRLPIVVSGPVNPGEPYIGRIDPDREAVGGVVTISGLNFGLERGNDSGVFFSWVTGEGKGVYGSEDTRSEGVV